MRPRPTAGTFAHRPNYQFSFGRRKNRHRKNRAAISQIRSNVVIYWLRRNNKSPIRITRAARALRWNTGNTPTYACEIQDLLNFYSTRILRRCVRYLPYCLQSARFLYLYTPLVCIAVWASIFIARLFLDRFPVRYPPPHPPPLSRSLLLPYQTGDIHTTRWPTDRRVYRISRATYFIEIHFIFSFFSFFSYLVQRNSRSELSDHLLASGAGRSGQSSCVDPFFGVNIFFFRFWFLLFFVRRTKFSGHRASRPLSRNRYSAIDDVNPAETAAIVLTREYNVVVYIFLLLSVALSDDARVISGCLS